MALLYSPLVLSHHCMGLRPHQCLAIHITWSGFQLRRLSSGEQTQQRRKAGACGKCEKEVDTEWCCLQNRTPGFPEFHAFRSSWIPGHVMWWLITICDQPSHHITSQIVMWTPVTRLYMCLGLTDRKNYYTCILSPEFQLVISLSFI